MGAGDTQFIAGIAAVYDRLLVPLLFESYATDLARRTANLKPRRVLETAAGTGVVTRALAAALNSTAQLTATDLNEPMLGIARERSADTGIRWQQADALSLPFDNSSFDAVVCQFGVMFFPDKQRGFREANRVLSPHGHFLFNVWTGIADNQFAQTVTDALVPLFPDSPPQFMARVPHGYHDATEIRSTLATAGFAGVSVEKVERVGRAASARDAAVAYCQGTPIRNEIEQRDASLLEEATYVAEQALTARFGKGPIEGRISALVFCCER